MSYGGRLPASPRLHLHIYVRLFVFMLMLNNPPPPLSPPLSVKFQSEGRGGVLPSFKITLPATVSADFDVYVFARRLAH